MSGKRQTPIQSRIHVLGALTFLFSLGMLPSILYSLIDDHHPDRWGLMISFLIGAGGGGLAYVLTRVDPKYKHDLNSKDAVFVVSIGWVLAGVIGALPYYLYAHLAPTSPCDASPAIVGSDFCAFSSSFFEAMSGFTTTGATIINQGLWDTYVDGVGRMSDGQLGLPRGIMLWRCTTHLLGGMGIIVLSVAVLPLLGVGGMQLFKAEVPGLKADKINPRVQKTASILWIVYGCLTVGLLLVFWISQSMDFFESLCHSMSTLATGGFSTRSASIEGFQDHFVEWMVILFMFLAGSNFALHHRFWTLGDESRKKRSFKMKQREKIRPKSKGKLYDFLLITLNRFRQYWDETQFKVYTWIVLLSTLGVAMSIYLAQYASSYLDSIRVALFQVLAIITTTGYASTNFELWVNAPFALLILVILMFVGGCTGSTGGGMKVLRHIVAFKYWKREFFFLLHPTGTRSIRIEDEVIESPVLRATLAFIVLYLSLMVLGTALFVLDGQDLTTAFTCSASSLGNVGPGLGDIGPAENYAVLNPFGLWVSSVLMMMGRLEIYVVLLLVTRNFWKK